MVQAMQICMLQVLLLTILLFLKVVEALRPHGLTLQNFASIREQTMGGFTQVGSHGSGATIPPVDEQVVSMKLVTPAQGCLELSQVLPCPALVCCAWHLSACMRIGLHVGLALSASPLLLMSHMISNQARSNC